MFLQIILAVAGALVGQSTPVAGSIRGVVVNASQGGVPVAGAEVVLRVRLDGQFVTAAQTIADEYGGFVFDNIPADEQYVYLAGANRAGVHYPGARVRLTSRTPHARVKLRVCDTVGQPNPLIVRRHDVTIHAQADALRVTEKLLIDNPSCQTYVGRPAREGGRAATLHLSIPSDFRRTTFHQEFFGRQFTLIDGRLVTDIPWTPGQRELSFTYVLPNELRQRIWKRPLDLPCDQLRVVVHTAASNEVTCNLPRAASPGIGSTVFESGGKTLPAGYVVRLELGHLPISVAAYGRWLALVLLVGLIAVTSLAVKKGVGNRSSAATARSGRRQPVRHDRAATRKSAA